MNKKLELQKAEIEYKAMKVIPTVNNSSEVTKSSILNGSVRKSTGK
jgi:hypothetical protein